MLQVLKLLSWSWGYYDIAINEGTFALEQLLYHNSLPLRDQSQTRSIDQTYQNLKLSQYTPNSQAPSVLPSQQAIASHSILDPLTQAQAATALLLAPTKGINLPNSYQTEEWVNNYTSLAPLSSSSSTNAYVDLTPRNQEDSATYLTQPQPQPQYNYLPNSSEINQFLNSPSRPYLHQEYSTRNNLYSATGSEQYSALPDHLSNQHSQNSQFSSHSTSTIPQFSSNTNNTTLKED